MEHLRGAGNEAVAVACERHGSKVVLLLHGVASAVETDVVYLAARDTLFGTGSLLVEAVGDVVGADVHPVGIAGGVGLVLQLDMVEAVGVDVEAVDGDGQVVACGVACGLRVKHPLVMRGRHGDRGGGRYEMDGEGGEGILHDVAGRAQEERDVLEVVTLSALHLYGLVDRSTVRESDG